MTTGLSYDGTVADTNSYVEQIANLAVVELNLAEPTDPFTILLPQMITYAENRMYRDLDFLFTSTSITGYSFSTGSRQITIPEGTVVVSEQINVITPSGQSDPDAGTRNPLLPVTKEFLDAVYGSSSYTGLPKYFTPFNDNLFLVGPFPDFEYFVEIVGTYRPASLSSTNKTTFISLYLPDVFIMASMVYISGYQRNFGRQSDDPAMAQSYESQYQALLRGAAVEEARKKFEASGWTSQAPTAVATPSRG
ncbi:hypothetical protein UFOVP661_4 [uncultured Caudovirales phage]|uniref:Uncharacterized protein n=1 Tax=uncultured Caudovirales phage TaxID=2100421 RepID=A0A6J5N7B4_9CAUD|nr:hypothetical protein UFOVP661_4 [uncultured Caudovirales phage]